MQRRHPRILPKTWLITDERMGDHLFDAIDRLPRGSAIIVRHYSWSLTERQALFARIVSRTRRHQHIVLRAGSDRLSRHENGVHGVPRARVAGLLTMSAHNRREALAAARRGADAVLLSPVFATRSHPGEPALGRVRFGLASRNLPIPVIALGGMDSPRARSLRQMRIVGWAAIDAWMVPQHRNQKRKAVPI